MERYVSIGEAAQIKGVSIDTLRLWEEKEILIPVRTEGGHRRYKLSDLLGANNNTNKKTVAYARVSSHDQKADARETGISLICIL